MRETEIGYLIDTHFVLWALADDEALTVSERNLLIDPSHRVFVSSASVWEIEIKRKMKKLSAPRNLLSAIDSIGFSRLDISFEHALAAGRLPHHHRDPFDRMLIAQSKSEKLTLLSRDKIFSKYR